MSFRWRQGAAQVERFQGLVGITTRPIDDQDISVGQDFADSSVFDKTTQKQIDVK